MILNKIAFAFFLLISSSFVLRATTYIDAEDCYNFEFEEAVFNNNTNLYDSISRNETFCGSGTNQTNQSTNYCSITNKVLKPGEVFNQRDNSCNIGITCNANASLFEFEVPIDITADRTKIYVTVGTDTKSYPRTSTGFSYNANRLVMCPLVEANLTEGDPESLRDCLAILKDESRINVDEKAEYKLCISERDNFKVEYEDRGRAIEDLNTQKGRTESSLNECRDDEAGANTTNWIFLILLVITISILIVQFIMKIRNNKISGSPF